MQARICCRSLQAWKKINYWKCIEMCFIIKKTELLFFNKHLLTYNKSLVNGNWFYFALMTERPGLKALTMNDMLHVIPHLSRPSIPVNFLITAWNVQRNTYIRITSTELHLIRLLSTCCSGSVCLWTVWARMHVCLGLYLCVSVCLRRIDENTSLWLRTHSKLFSRSLNDYVCLCLTPSTLFTTVIEFLNPSDPLATHPHNPNSLPHFTQNPYIINAFTQTLCYC